MSHGLVSINVARESGNNANMRFLSFQSDGDVLLLLVRRELLLLPGMLRCLLLSSMINAIDDTFLLAGVGISRYVPQCSGTDHCTLSIAIVHFSSLLHQTFVFSGHDAL
jgi:hypothetical protein